MGTGHWALGNGQWAMAIKEAAFRDGRINRIFSMPHAPCPMPHAPLPIYIIRIATNFNHKAIGVVKIYAFTCGTGDGTVCDRYFIFS